MSRHNDLISSNYVQVGDLRIHYLAAGEGAPIVLLHGWPTSSYLWRRIIVPLSASNKVVAPDLPGFGKSDKPLHTVYTPTYLSDVLGEFLKVLNIEKVVFVLDDVGVSVGLLWIIRNVQKVEKIAITNSLIYHDGCAKLYFTYEVCIFKRILMTVLYAGVPIFLKVLLLALRMTGFEKLVFTPWPGVNMIIKLGVKHKKRMTKKVCAE